mmetsp:Transcript_43303/g.108771  ORF Transcript_43303/g.108771 Transcript_43303/m.108771 type:complete len:220 (-) Transcript_43303:631-1290(-)
MPKHQFLKRWRRCGHSQDKPAGTSDEELETWLYLACCSCCCRCFWPKKSFQMAPVVITQQSLGFLTWVALLASHLGDARSLHGEGVPAIRGCKSVLTSNLEIFSMVGGSTTSSATAALTTWAVSTASGTSARAVSEAVPTLSCSSCTYSSTAAAVAVTATTACSSDRDEAAMITSDLATTGSSTTIAAESSSNAASDGSSISCIGSSSTVVAAGTASDL